MTALMTSFVHAWGQSPSPAPLVDSTPYIVLPLFVTGAWHARGVIRMYRQRVPLRVLEVLCFAAGWTSLLLALASPVHELSEQLFWVHMTQHEILMIVAAPLLVLGRPAVVFLWALPARWRAAAAKPFSRPITRKIWAFLSAPLAAWLLHAAALWSWHLPWLFDATFTSDFVHAAQHLSFLATALLFWWSLVHGHGHGMGYGLALVYVFTTAIHTSLLGALLTFAPTVWYTPYLATAPAWHLTALQDQQLGGLIMWIPAGTVLLAISLVLLVKWMAEAERRYQYTRMAALGRITAGVSHEN